MGGMGGGRPDGEKPDGNFPGPGGDGENTGNMNFEAMDGIGRMNVAASGLSLTGTYETAQDYIDALNAEGEWVTWDEATGKVTITSVADFTQRLKNASKSLGAFDQLDAGQGENTLFGYGDGNGAHFDAILAELVAGSEYAEAYATDLSREDTVGNTVDVRVNMYNPMYYLSAAYEGYQTAEPAAYWRIRTGITQGDTALCTEVDLALAAEAYSDQTQVDFETVWAQGHTEAERSGSATANFIAWVNECMNE